MKINDIITEAVKQRLDAKCWTGKHKEGTKIKGGVRVNNCVPNESVAEGSESLDYQGNCTEDDVVDDIFGDVNNFANMVEKYGDEFTRGKLVVKYDPETDVHSFYYKTQGVAENSLNEFAPGAGDDGGGEDPYQYPEPKRYSRSINYFGQFEADHFDKQVMDDITGEFKGYWNYNGKLRQVAYFKFDNPAKTDSDDPGMGWYYEPQNESVAKSLTPDQMFDIIEEMVEQVAAEHGVDPELIWEEFDSVDDNELFESAAWRRKEGKSKKGGLNAKGVASYRRENPGSKLQTAVTTKPGKLKPGSKAAKRRKSFCARMGGVKGPMKKPNGKPTRKALALRKWNC